MQASPYDLLELGYEPVRIETPEGKTEYLSRQREFTVRSNALRRRLVEVLEQGVAHSGGGREEPVDAALEH